MVPGYLHAQASSGSELAGISSSIWGLAHEMMINDILRQAVAADLGRHFKRSPAEQKESLDRFYDDARFRATYDHLPGE